MRFKKVYLEITNVCNLNCSFCHGTLRPPHFLSAVEFEQFACKLRNYTEYLYFHLLGEPLLHPELGVLLDAAGRMGFRVNLTTNGTLLSQTAETLLSAAALHRVNISLQSWEANSSSLPLYDYANECADFAKAAAKKGTLISLRLWNAGGAERCNDEILSLLHAAFPGEWKTTQHNTVLDDRIFLEIGDKFDWPDLSAEESGTRFCRGLRDQIGVLCDGTVVPCCLDADGTLALGNLFHSTLEDILQCERARNIYDGFSHRKATEELCRKCGYAAHFF